MDKGKYREEFVKALSKRADIYNLIGSNDKAMNDARRALREARASSDVNILAQAYELMAFLYNKTSRYKLMKNSASNALKLYKKTGNKQGQSACMGYIGDYFMFTGNTDKALEYYKKAIKISKSINDLRTEADNATNMGFIYGDYMHESKKAIKFHEKAIQLARRLQDRQIEGASMNNIANTYHMSGDLDTAEQYLTQSLQIIKDIGDMEGISSIYNNIGVINFQKGNISKAIEYFEQSLAIRRRTGDIRGVGISLNNLGYLYDDLGKTDKALKYNLEALKVRRSINDKAGEASTLINIGTHYFKIGEFKEAEHYLRMSLKMKTELKDNKGINKCQNLLTQIKKTQAPPNPQPGP